MSPRTLRIIVRFVPLLFAFLAQAALADQSTDFGNIGGALSRSDAAPSPTGSKLHVIATFSGTAVVGNLGIVSFSTGGLVSGSLQMGRTSAGEGSLTINGNGKNTVTDGVLFFGAFTGPVSWTLTTLANGTHNYTLTAVVTETMGSTPARGVSVQLTNTGKGFFNGSNTIASGDARVVSFVPEPSTLAMLSTGLLAIAGGRRRLIG